MWFLVQCLLILEWNDQLFIDDGVLSYSCDIFCNTGYEIQAGDDMLTCQSDGIFNGTSATCGRGV